MPIQSSEIDEIFDISKFSVPFSEKRIRLGMPANVAAHTRELCAGVYLALEDRRARLGAEGRPVEVIWRDDHREDAAAREVARQLADDGVRHVVGHLSASAALGASEVYEDRGVLFLAPGTSHPALTDGDRSHVFRVCGNDVDQAEEIVRKIRRRPQWHRVALIEQEIEYGQILSHHLQSAWARTGDLELPVTKVPREGGLEPDEVQRILDRRPDLIVVAGIHEIAAEVLPTFRRRGYEGDFLLSDDAFTPALVDLAGSAAEGAWVVSLGADPESEAVDRLHECYRRLTGADIGAYFLTSYCATAMLFEALDRHGDDPQVLAEVLRRGAWDGPLGRLRFTERGDVHGVSWELWRVRDGKFELASEKARVTTTS